MHAGFFKLPVVKKDFEAKELGLQLDLITSHIFRSNTFKDYDDDVVKLISDSIIRRLFSVLVLDNGS